MAQTGKSCCNPAAFISLLKVWHETAAAEDPDISHLPLCEHHPALLRRVAMIQRRAAGCWVKLCLLCGARRLNQTHPGRAALPLSTGKMRFLCY